MRSCFALSMAKGTNATLWSWSLQALRSSPNQGAKGTNFKSEMLGLGNKGALMIRRGFWGPLYYISYNEEPPK